MHLKGGSVALLGCQQAGQVAANLPYLFIGARNMDTVTPCRAGCSSYEVIVLVGCHHEQGIAGINTIFLESFEEFAKGVVVGLELRHVTRFTRAKGVAGNVVIMRI